MNNLITFVPCATTRCSTDLEVQVSYLPEEAVLRDLDLVRAEEIAPFYPGTEVDYLLKKFKAQKLSARRCGEPLLATVRDNSLVVGCLVVTPKAFRSQKLGPIWVRDVNRPGFAGDLQPD